MAEKQAWKALVNLIEKPNGSLHKESKSSIFCHGEQHSPQGSEPLATLMQAM